LPRVVDVNVLDNLAVHPSYVGFKARIELPDDLQGYSELWRAIEAVAARAPTHPGAYLEWKSLMRLWSAGDWYFRLMFLLMAGRDAWNEWRHEPHFWHPVHIELARWCQFGDHETEYLIASRGLGKSTHLTLNDDIGQKILDPNHASVTFSHTREYAAKHQGIKLSELRLNKLLSEVWHDRFFNDPDEDAEKFSVKDGINVKRATARMETSFSAHAFVDSLPVGSHFDKRYYDDIEVDKTVESDEFMDKVEDRYVSSQDLSSSQRRKAVTGTYYHPNGPMRRLELKYGMTPRVWPCERLKDRPRDPAEAGPKGGRPINGFTAAELHKLVQDKGGVNSPKAMRSYGRQNLCDPKAGELVNLDPDFIGWYDYSRVLEIARACNIYITLDPSPGSGNDPSWAWVWGLHLDGGYYWLDGFRARMPPGRRTAEVYLLGVKWGAIGNLLEFRVESFGQSGVSEGQEEYNRLQGMEIPVIKCADTKTGKREREYEAWQPPLYAGTLRFPGTRVQTDSGWKWERGTMWRQDEFQKPIDLVAYFIDFELGMYPQPATDDGLDGGGLLWARDGIAPPLQWPQPPPPRESHEDLHDDEGHGGFMSGGVL
jgi:hypothetical protein